MRNRQNRDHGSNQWVRFFFGSPGKAVFWGGVAIAVVTFPWLLFLSLARPGFLQAALENLRIELQPLFALAIQSGVIIFGLWILLKKVRPKKKK